MACRLVGSGLAVNARALATGQEIGVYTVPLVLEIDPARVITKFPSSPSGHEHRGTASAPLTAVRLSALGR